MPCHDLDKAVLEAAINAVENGYIEWSSPEALATDMATCDSELENYETGDIVLSLVRLNILNKEGDEYVIGIPSDTKSET